MTPVSFRAFSDELQKTAGKIALPQAGGQIFRELLKGAPVKVKITELAKAYGGGYYDREKKEVGLTKKDYETLAHEVGHAQVDKHVLGRLIQHDISRSLSDPMPSTLAAIGAGLLAAKGMKWGLLLPTALAAPTLISEALASHKGHKLLESAGASEEQRAAYRKNMIAAFKSYLATPLLGTLVAAAVASTKV